MIHQLNALNSWLTFCPQCEVIIIEDEQYTTSSVINENKRIKIIRDVKRAMSGAPYLNDVIEKACDLASSDYICYINGDIILLDDFFVAFKSVKNKFKDFLLTSRRFDLAIGTLLDFKNNGNIQHLKKLVKTTYPQRHSKGTDFFVFRKNSLGDIPPFIIGRLVWSRWFIYKALQLGYPVIDGTPVITAIHQIHGYEHVNDQKVKHAIERGFRGYDAIVRGDEYRWNLLLGKFAAYFSEEDCNYLLTQLGLVKRSDLKFILRRALKKPLLTPYVQDIFAATLRTMIPNKLIRSLIKRAMYQWKLLY